MIKAPYVRPRMIGNEKVFSVRPTPALLNAFPFLKFKTYTDKREANALGHEWKRNYEAWKLHREVIGEIDPASVRALVDEWKNSMAFSTSRLSDSTRRSYLHHLSYLMEIPLTTVLFGEMLVSEVDGDYADELFEYIQDEISTHKAHHCVKVLKLVWKKALKGAKSKLLYKAPGNVFREVECPALPPRRVMWEIDQIKGMIKYCDDMGYPSMGTMITMCYEFCQRPVDVRKFKWSNIEGKTGVSSFVQQKTGKDMAIGMTKDLKHRISLHTRRNTDDFIFAYEATGKPFTADRCNKVFRKLADGYGLPIVPLYNQFNKDGSQKVSNMWLADLRRTGATNASRAGCTDRELMALTGHKNPKMLVVYAVEGEIESNNANIKRFNYPAGRLNLGAA